MFKEAALYIFYCVAIGGKKIGSRHQTQTRRVGNGRSAAKGKEREEGGEPVAR